MDWTATTYSDPRLLARIEDWPSGLHSVTADFSIEVDPKRGERAVRVTWVPPAGRANWVPPAGRANAAKKLTFARKMRIVTGNDGRTYIAALTDYGHITIHRGDMKFHHESVFERDPRYAELKALFA
jgi:hypothetical protein